MGGTVLDRPPHQRDEIAHPATESSPAGPAAPTSRTLSPRPVRSSRSSRPLRGLPDDDPVAADPLLLARSPALSRRPPVRRARTGGLGSWPRPGRAQLLPAG